MRTLLGAKLGSLTILHVKLFNRLLGNVGYSKMYDCPSYVQNVWLSNYSKMLENVFI